MTDKTILVVDDEPKITEVVKSYLEKSGYKAVCAYDGREALDLFDRSRPALVVLDLMLPGLSGEHVCRKIRARSRVPVIMLTAKTAEEDMLKGLDIGADDYITKPFSPRLLMAKIETVLRRTSSEVVPLSRELAFDAGRLVIDSERHEVRKDGEPVSLTPNEYSILFTMASFPTRAFSRDELITHALGDSYDGYDRVIDTHIKNLRQKLEDDSKNPKYILTVHGVGYSFGGRM
jgi:Response regulators consisting of a CheY-like receiver domain and a winged-helix DNA-binding domain